MIFVGAEHSNDGPDQRQRRQDDCETCGGDAIGRAEKGDALKQVGDDQSLEPVHVWHSQDAPDGEGDGADFGAEEVGFYVVVATPGFSADCLETLEEIAIQGREQFLEAGGTDFAALSCLNDGDAGMAMLETLMRRELAGWI